MFQNVYFDLRTSRNERTTHVGQNREEHQAKDSVLLVCVVGEKDALAKSFLLKNSGHANEIHKR